MTEQSFCMLKIGMAYFFKVIGNTAPQSHNLHACRLHLELDFLQLHAQTK